MEGDLQEKCSLPPDSLEKYFQDDDDDDFVQTGKVSASTSYKPQADRIQFRGFTFKRGKADQTQNMVIPPKRFKAGEGSGNSNAPNRQTLKGPKFGERPSSSKSMSPQALKGTKTADGTGGKKPAKPQMVKGAEIGERPGCSKPWSPQALKGTKTAGGAGGKNPAKPQAVKGRKKEGLSEINGNVLAVCTPRVDCWFKKIQMIVNMISLAKEWELRLEQIMREIPNMENICESI
ncbi:uncharacterized protein LOC140704575 [Pogona vitticeps]